MTIDRRIDRKAAIRAYKERPPRRGIYAVRCAATGEAWIGSTTNLDAARNREWFTLRLGSHVDRGLQAAWTRHGADAFHYEVLEALDADVPEVHVPDRLADGKRDWAARLGARALL